MAGDAALGLRVAAVILLSFVFVVVSSLLASLPGVSWGLALTIGGLVVGLGGASWACFVAWWRE